jgi:hypothetical protein
MASQTQRMGDKVMARLGSKKKDLTKIQIQERAKIKRNSRR